MLNFIVTLSNRPVTNSPKAFLFKYHRLIFYSTWLLLHVIQAYTTELFDDEGYYWIYSKFLAWGYFDHPPMIAVLIKAGYSFFHNEFGVRLLSIILNTATIFLVETLIERKNAFLFYAICASLALAQIGGMLAVPDTPLMFFVALFFYLYRRFINNMSIINSLLLGLSIALMFYTKYHAMLIVLFTVLSNLRLFRHYQTYLAAIFSLILFIPHIYWQHINGYPSVLFHLFERNASEYDFKVTIEYIIGQILMPGPIMGWLLILGALRYKPESLTEKALRFTFIGIYVFFLTSTLKGKAEANWTIPCFIGLMVLSHQYLLTHARFRKLLYYSVPFTLAVVFAGRIIMMIDMPPAWWIFKDEFHGNKTYVTAVKVRAKNAPVVFIDSYQKPSKYWFYSGDTALGLNTPKYRRNNFNFWQIEDSYIGKPAYVVGSYDRDLLNEVFISRRLEKNGGKLIPLYYSFSRVLIDGIKINEIGENKISVKFKTKTPPVYLSYFKQSPYDTAVVYLSIYEKKKVVNYLRSNMTVKDIEKIRQENIVSFDLHLPPGSYIGKFALSSCLPGQPSLNSSGFEIKVK